MHAAARLTSDCAGAHVQHPVVSSQAEVLAEVAAVQMAGSQLCPLRIALERIVATSSGNILACWQVISGSDPATIRRCSTGHSSI